MELTARLYDVSMTLAAPRLHRNRVTHRRGAAVCCALLVAAALAPQYAAHADPIAVINGFRTNGCGREPAPRTRVRPDTALDAVARALGNDMPLEDALEEADYPAASSASFHARGSRDDEAIRRLLAQRFCGAINDPRYTEIGVFQRRDETWIVLAARQAAPPQLEPFAVQQRVLTLVNAARAAPRTCGRRHFEPTQPLQLSDVLSTAALAHARDMAERGLLTHEGSDGSASGDRITRAGYVWRAAGENVAAGQRDADAVVAAWLSSPGHCATLMGPHFTEMGVAFAPAPGKNPGIYWAQTFAAPR